MTRKKPVDRTSESTFSCLRFQPSSRKQLPSPFPGARQLPQVRGVPPQTNLPNRRSNGDAGLLLVPPELLCHIGTQEEKRYLCNNSYGKEKVYTKETRLSVCTLHNIRIKWTVTSAAAECSRFSYRKPVAARRSFQPLRVQMPVAG